MTPRTFRRSCSVARADLYNKSGMLGETRSLITGANLTLLSMTCCSVCAICFGFVQIPLRRLIRNRYTTLCVKVHYYIACYPVHCTTHITLHFTPADVFIPTSPLSAARYSFAHVQLSELGQYGEERLPKIQSSRKRI